MNVVSLVFLLLLAQVGSQAADPEAKAKAQTLLKDGARSYRQGSFANALEKFNQAYAVFPSPKLLYNIGQANRELGRSVEAVEAFDKFLSLSTDASPELMSDARRSLNELYTYAREAAHRLRHHWRRNHGGQQEGWADAPP
jgi:tetratricopeptide (TPR) repeat protein